MKSLEPTHEAEIEWKKTINDMYDTTLVKNTDSWWNAGNIPGKQKEALIFLGGVEMYENILLDKLDGFKGFIVKM